MSKSNLLKVFFSLVLSIVLILMVTTVNAADSNGFNDITPQLTNNSAGTGNTGSGTTNTNSGSGSTNTNRANTGSTNTNRANTSANKSSNTNSSIYNNSNLPKTGLSDSLPVVLLVVVFGISAIYAYKKIKDYRNI